MPTTEYVHYYGYAGKPIIGIPCGASPQSRDGETQSTSYAHSVTCPACRSILDAQFSTAVRNGR